MDYKLLLNVAMLAGEIMIRSGAETYRVEDTMEHILKKSNLETIEAYAMMTGIVATIDDKKLEKPMTKMISINRRSTNLAKIMRVNELSRQYCGDSITLQEAYEKLQAIKGREYQRVFYNLAMIGVAVGFVMMFGGNFVDVIAAAIVGAILGCIVTIGKMGRFNSILVDILSGVGISFASILINTLTGGMLNTDIVIISTMMSIVPGVAITTAIRDTLYGDYLSGSARILEAFVKAASIALGVGLGMGGASWL